MGWTKNYQTKRRVVSAAQWRPEHPGDVAALLAENGMTYKTCDLHGQPRIEVYDPNTAFTHGGIGPGMWLVVDDGELFTYGPDQFIEKFEARSLRGGA